MNQLNDILFAHRLRLETSLKTLRGICNNLSTNGSLWAAQDYWHDNNGTELQRAYTVADHYVSTLQTPKMVVKHINYDANNLAALEPLIPGTVPTADDAASLVHDAGNTILVKSDTSTTMHTVVVLMDAGGMECIKCNADELPSILKTRREMDCDIYVDGIPVLDGKLQADKTKYIIEGLGTNYNVICSRSCDHDGLWDAVHTVFYTKRVQYIRVNDELCSCTFDDSNLVVKLPDLTTTLGANCDPITDDLLANQKRMHL